MSLFTSFKQVIGKGVQIDLPDGVFSAGVDPTSGQYQVAVVRDKSTAQFVGQRAVGATQGQRVSAVLPGWAILGIVALIAALAFGGLARNLK